MGETRDPERDQPLPEPGTVDIQLYLMRALVARRDHGIRKYGRPLESNNGRVALLDLWEELLDGLLYCTQALTEMGVPLAHVPIPEGHPAYSLVQDLIEGDAQAQASAREKLGKPVPRCMVCGKARDRSGQEATAELERAGWIFQALKAYANTAVVDAEGGGVTTADMLDPMRVLQILDGKLVPGVEI